MNRHLGRFSINLYLIEDCSEAVMRIMADCIPVRAEMMYASNSIEYTAISPRWFRAVEPGELIPEYRFILNENAVEQVQEMGAVR